MPTKVFGAAQTDVAELERQLNTTTPELAAAQATWEHEQASRIVNWEGIDDLQFGSEGGATAARQDDAKRNADKRHIRDRDRDMGVS